MTEGRIRTTVRRGCPEPPESLALGTLSKGLSRNFGKASLSPSTEMSEVAGGRGQPESASDG
jgi:hypothetical protein